MNTHEAGTAGTVPAAGQRIRLTAVGTPDHVLYPGAEGTITEVYPQAVAVAWDDPSLADIAPLRGVDTWEVLA